MALIPNPGLIAATPHFSLRSQRLCPRRPTANILSLYSWPSRVAISSLKRVLTLDNLLWLTSGPLAATSHRSFVTIDYNHSLETFSSKVNIFISCCYSRLIITVDVCLLPAMWLQQTRQPSSFIRGCQSDSLADG